MPSQGAPEVSLIIPAYNEAHRLEASFRALQEYLETVPWSREVIFVIEQSDDGTLDLARRLMAEQADFQVIGNQDHRGKGYAVRCGMLAAKGDTAFFMDLDLSTPLVEIGHFLRAFIERPEVDILIGNRQHPQSRIAQHQNWVRQRMGITFNWILRSLTGMRFHDTQCGFKAFRKLAREAIFAQQKLDGFAFDAEVLLLAEQLGYRVAEMPVEWRNSEGSKVHLVRDSWRMLRDAWKVRGMRDRELKAPVS